MSNEYTIRNLENIINYSKAQHNYFDSLQNINEQIVDLLGSALDTKNTNDLVNIKYHIDKHLEQYNLLLKNHYDNKPLAYNDAYRFNNIHTVFNINGTLFGKINDINHKNYRDMVDQKLYLKKNNNVETIQVKKGYTAKDIVREFGVASSAVTFVQIKFDYSIIEEEDHPEQSFKMNITINDNTKEIIFPDMSRDVDITNENIKEIYDSIIKEIKSLSPSIYVEIEKSLSIEGSTEVITLNIIDPTGENILIDNISVSQDLIDVADGDIDIDFGSENYIFNSENPNTTDGVELIARGSINLYDTEPFILSREEVGYYESSQIIYSNLHPAESMLNNLDISEYRYIFKPCNLLRTTFRKLYHVTLLYNYSESEKINIYYYETYYNVIKNILDIIDFDNGINDINMIYDTIQLFNKVNVIYDKYKSMINNFINLYTIKKQDFIQQTS